jgi:hypothetical protein
MRAREQINRFFVSRSDDEEATTPKLPHRWRFEDI